MEKFSSHKAGVLYGNKEVFLFQYTRLWKHISTSHFFEPENLTLPGKFCIIKVSRKQGDKINEIRF